MRSICGSRAQLKHSWVVDKAGTPPSAAASWRQCATPCGAAAAPRWHPCYPHCPAHQQDEQAPAQVARRAARQDGQAKDRALRIRGPASATAEGWTARHSVEAVAPQWQRQHEEQGQAHLGCPGESAGPSSCTATEPPAGALQAARGASSWVLTAVSAAGEQRQCGCES